MEIYRSARKHRIADEDMLHAIAHAIAVGEQDDAKILYLEPDRASNLLEVVTVARDDGTEIVIHAMPMRPSTSRSSTVKEAPMPEHPTHGRSKAGDELTDDALDRMADEAEAGLDTTRLRRRPGRPAIGTGPAETFPVRLDPELRDALDQRAADDHTTASDVIRQALRRYLEAS